MAATKTPAKKHRPSGHSGPTLTKDERRAKGQERLDLWLGPEAVEALESIVAARGISRTEAVELALKTAAPRLTK
jgi:hypothetical protein